MHEAPLSGVAGQRDIDARVRAYHEAGHFVAAAILQRRITKASIERRDGHDGVVSVTDLHAHQLRRRERDVVIALAGPAAEARLRGGKYSRLAAEGDFRFARETVDDIASRRGEQPDVVRRDRLRSALEHAKHLVEAHWPSVERVADELLSKQTLSNVEIRRHVRVTRSVGSSSPESNIFSG